MPLSKSCSSKARSANIRELFHNGKPLNQAIAIAMSLARKQGCKIKKKKK